MALTSPSSTADQLERGFIFRLSRLLPLGLAVVAGGIAVIAIIVMMVSFVPTSKPAEPRANPAPAPVVVSVADVAARLAPAQATAAARTVAASASDTATPAEAVRLAVRLHAVRRLMTEANVPWENRYRTVCTSSYAGYCFGTERRLTTRGASRDVDEVLELYNASPMPVTVTVADSAKTRGEAARARYEVDYSNAAAKQTALDEAAAILAATPAADRRATLRAWAELRAERETARQEAITAEEERLAAERTLAASEYESARTQRKLWRASAITATGVALASIFTVALLLGVLAIERNTRALREQGKAAGDAVFRQGHSALPASLPG